MKTIIENTPCVIDSPLANLDHGQVGILTAVPGGWSKVKVGDPVIGVDKKVAALPKSGQYCDITEQVRFRPLAKGERVIFEGE